MQALKVYKARPRAAGTSAAGAGAGSAGGSSSQYRTVDSGCIVNFFDLDKFPRVFPSDLRAHLQPWEGKYRLNSIDNAHAIASTCLL
jgi:hypothetical protein